MKWKDECFTALDKENMFEDSGHRTRFKELMDCYSSYPFFNKGLCKCMYLSAWDEAHFCILLETLMDLSLGKEKNTEEMRSQGEILAEEQSTDEYYVYELAHAFLDGKKFQMDYESKVSPEIRYIISRALSAAEIIDNV